jgi:5-hydroxyisourate hydrolase
MSKLSTHVLDLAQGKPAAGLRVELYLLGAAGDRMKLRDTVTNADGRTDEPLLTGEQVLSATYELIFHAGDYFRAEGLAGDYAFVDVVPIRFTAQAGGSYHVPLLCSPWAFSTYRGS